MKTIITFSGSHIRALVFSCVILFCFLQTGYAQSVTLDPTFGQSGITIIPNTTEIRLLDFDKSGNIIAVGYTQEGNKDYLTIVKTDSNGILDLNFGDNGIVTLPEVSWMPFLGLKITDANKIFIAGSFFAEQYDDYKTTYLQFNEDGSVDETFGEHGKIIINDDAPNFIYGFHSLSIENDNFLLFGGNDAHSRDPFIVKRNYDGMLDETFGENGIVYLTYHETFKIFPTAIKILKDQSIFIGGFTPIVDDIGYELAFCKLTPNGDLATDFANNGLWKMKTYGVGLMYDEYPYFADVIEKSNGELVLFGTFNSVFVTQNPKPVFICNFHSNGELNKDFGTDGFYYYRHVQNPDFIHSSAQKILQNGSKYITAFQNDKIMTITHNGTLDTAFNNTGIFICGNYAFEDVKLQGTDKLILGGSSNGNFSIARLNIPFDDPVISVQPYFNNDRLITVFPNPAKDYLYFNSEQQFEIMDIQGRILLRSENAAQAVNVSHLKTGIYFIKFEDGGVRKFVKE